MAGSLTWKFLALTGQFDRAYHAAGDSLATAATGAMDDIAIFIKRDGRADILASGLGNRWANALRVIRFPKRGISMRPAVWAFHRIAYADVFERGLTVHGRPLLWIPLATTAAKFNRGKLTPSVVAARFGDLISINRPGKPPLLAAKVAGRISVKTQQFSARSINRGSQIGARNVSLLPLFVGLPAVDERKRTHLLKVFAEAGGRLAERFAANFKGN